MNIQSKMKTRDAKNNPVGIGVRAGHVPFKLPVPVTVGCTVI